MNTQPSRKLPIGTRLPHNYIIDNVLGEGGFGITYSGYVQNTKEKVAIKEYFPGELSYRLTDSDTPHTIVPYAGSEAPFEKGCDHFRKEASILKEFQHLLSIVSVKDILEANGTVYLVMEYIDGITLKQYVKENGVLTYHELVSLITPVIQALIQIHKRGILHRDISPENIMVGTDNQFHLIDFGAASYENSHITKTITVILKSGYAPPEQYLSDGKQGAWTDVYALAATMYYALTGITPTDSIRRMQTDDLPYLITLTPIDNWQSDAIEKGMQLSAALRYQNMETFYQALRIPPMQQDLIQKAYLENSIEDNKTIIKVANPRHPISQYKKLWISGAILLLVILGTIAIGIRNQSKNIPIDTEASSDTLLTEHSSEEPASTTASTEQRTTSTELPNRTETATTRQPASSTEASTTATTQSNAERATQKSTKKQTYDVVPDDDNSYETIQLK